MATEKEISEYLEKNQPRNVPWGLAGVTPDQMKDGTHYASGLYLREWRESLGLGQFVVGEAVGVTKGRISQIETDDFIPQDMRWNLWHFVFTQADLYAKREAQSRSPLTPDEFAKETVAFWQKYGAFENAGDRVKKALQNTSKLLAMARHERDELKRILNFPLYDRCLFLEAQNAKLLETIADYSKLFNLKGEAVAVDEAASVIEARLKSRKAGE